MIADAPAELSDRDREVLQLLAEGCTLSEIARQLCWSYHTIRLSLYRCYEHFGLKPQPGGWHYRLVWEGILSGIVRINADS